MSNQLFIGRLPRGCSSRDLEDIFYKYGKMTRCDVKQGIKMAYGFIEYEDRRDAEDALRSEHGREVMGARIVVEWARGPRYDYRRDRYRDDDEGRDRQNSVVQSRDRYDHYRSRDRDKDRDYDRRRSRSRSRSRSKDRSDDYDRKRSRSRSRDRGRQSRS